MTRDDPTPFRQHLRTFLGCVATGAVLCLSVPPFGWWPLAFVGIFGWDRLIADQPWRARARRSWLVAAAWLAPSMVWMADLTLPGYVVVIAVFSGYFAGAAALIPGDHRRWIGFPFALVLAEQARWSFPFGGVPLSHLAMSQADAPLRFVVRIAGPLLLVAVVAWGGVALSAAWERRWAAAGIAGGLVIGLGVVGWLAPSGYDLAPIEVAVVQGGGPQRTRAADTDEEVVFRRHLEASQLVETPVDLVLWPENVVNIEGPIESHEWNEELSELARELDTTLSVGIVEGVDDDFFRNAQIVYDPDGSIGDRYDKVRIVPFGEWVPARGVMEAIAGEDALPSRDVIPGSGPGVLETDMGDMGVVISWEVFFANRAQAAAAEDVVLVLNPTNGASYWLTQVQSQQIASSRLRALETGRWVLQAAPTGFSAIVTPDGVVTARTGITEQAVLQQTVMTRGGRTWASYVGHWPMFVLAIGVLATLRTVNPWQSRLDVLPDRPDLT